MNFRSKTLPARRRPPTAAPPSNSFRLQQEHKWNGNTIGTQLGTETQTGTETQMERKHKWNDINGTETQTGTETQMERKHKWNGNTNRTDTHMERKYKRERKHKREGNTNGTEAQTGTETRIERNDFSKHVYQSYKINNFRGCLISRN
jgi:hypothetical protein